VEFDSIIIVLAFIIDHACTKEGINLYCSFNDSRWWLLDGDWSNEGKSVSHQFIHTYCVYVHWLLFQPKKLWRFWFNSSSLKYSPANYCEACLSTNILAVYKKIRMNMHLALNLPCRTTQNRLSKRNIRTVSVFSDYVKMFSFDTKRNNTILKAYFRKLPQLKNCPLINKLYSQK
jgi:hypothetical protein